MVFQIISGGSMLVTTSVAQGLPMFRVLSLTSLFFCLTLTAMLWSAPSGAQQVSVLDTTTLLDLQSRIADLVILDVRSPEEYRAGHVAGAINLPYEQIPGGLQNIVIETSQPVVAYCQSGARAAVALQALHQAGFSKLGYLQGDFPAWKASGAPVVEGSCANTSTAGADCQCGGGAC